MTKRLVRTALLLTLLGLAACSSGDRVVLLTDPDGHLGSVQVTSIGGASQRLVEAKSGLTVASTTAVPTPPAPVSDQTIEEVWGRALRALPPHPQTTLLYFETGTATLTAESLADLPKIAETLRQWPYPHLQVIGHADATGSDEVNLQVSRQRAEKVRDLLVGMGVPAVAILVDSHGKRNPLIPTADGVAEPRNRRVSVTIQ